MNSNNSRNNNDARHYVRTAFSNNDYQSPPKIRQQ